jgi:undecaprenyl diphosphate synthase
MESDRKIPNHIGFIVDGNRRWAKVRGLSVYDGHMTGYEVMHDIAAATFRAGVKYVSAYIFSTENWKRSAEEVHDLLGLVMQLLTSDIDEFNKNNIQLKILGSRENLSNELIAAIDSAEEKTKDNSGGILALCFNYGGHQEIVDAVKKIVQSGMDVNKIDVNTIENNIYNPSIPPVDLIVRTSGEQRLSNFMLWRSA